MSPSISHSRFWRLSLLVVIVFSSQIYITFPYRLVALTVQSRIYNVVKDADSNCIITYYGSVSPSQCSQILRINRKSNKMQSLRLAMNVNEPGCLFLMRNAEDELFNSNMFTGWIDADINEKGAKEVENAVNLMRSSGLNYDITYTSLLKRSIRTALLLNVGLSQMYKPIVKDWKLNERCYGALEGKSKLETAVAYGEETVQAIRKDVYTRPPPLDKSHPHWHADERKYSDLSKRELPRGESLMDTMDRSASFYHNVIKPDLEKGKNVMVVAHANSLRGIVRELEVITNEEAKDEVYFPRAIPLVYYFDENMRPIVKKGSIKPFSGAFISDSAIITKAIQEETLYANFVPGMADYRRKNNLNIAKNENLITHLSSYEKFMHLASAYTSTSDNKAKDDVEPSLKKLEYAPSVNKTTLATNKEDYLVIIRHGKTTYNKYGIFTGWEDAPLIDQGREQAKLAGKLLKLHGFEFDIVYTSWLSRAIETAYLAINELDELWLPVVQSWRLNERMYGALTGMSKNMIKEKHGLEMFKTWRKSYDIPPPRTDSYSPSYPGNDERYIRNQKDIDLRYSVFESILRSISFRKLVLHKKFPKTESLKRCMQRTIPYFTNTIIPESVAKGKSLLISSSENAIRGLLMHLMDIPPDKISKVEIPNGLPLIYNFKLKCIQLLDDGKERDSPLGLWEEYNFGLEPDLLFKPCNYSGDDVSSDVTDSCFLFTVNGKSFKHDPIIRLE